MGLHIGRHVKSYASKAKNCGKKLTGYISGKNSMYKLSKKFIHKLKNIQKKYLKKIQNSIFDCAKNENYMDYHSIGNLLSGVNNNYFKLKEFYHNMSNKQKIYYC